MTSIESQIATANTLPSVVQAMGGGKGKDHSEGSEMSETSEGSEGNERSAAELDSLPFAQHIQANLGM